MPRPVFTFSLLIFSIKFSLNSYPHHWKICLLILRERERETSMGCLPYTSQLETEPTTWVCALTRDQTCNLLVCGTMLQPTDPPGQGSSHFLWKSLLPHHCCQGHQSPRCCQTQHFLLSPHLNGSVSCISHSCSLGFCDRSVAFHLLEWLPLLPLLCFLLIFPVSSIVQGSMVRPLFYLHSRLS